MAIVTNLNASLRSALSLVLSGLSTTVATVVNENDTLLTAIGKLQGQVTKNRLLSPARGSSWYKTDKWIPVDHPFFAGVTNASPIVGSIYFVRRSIFDDASFKKIGAFCVTANASSTLIIGVYNDVNGKPSTLIDKKTFVASSTGELSSTVSFNLSVGYYWDAILLTGVSTTMRGATPLFAIDGLSSTAENPTTHYRLASQTDLPADVSALSLVLTQATPVTRVCLQVA